VDNVWAVRGVGLGTVPLDYGWELHHTFVLVPSDAEIPTIDKSDPCRNFIVHSGNVAIAKLLGSTTDTATRRAVLRELRHLPVSTQVEIALRAANPNV
jgi:hypothetical protein